jgi:hypothetical protein
LSSEKTAASAYICFQESKADLTRSPHDPFATASPSSLPEWPYIVVPEPDDLGWVILEEGVFGDENSEEDIIVLDDVLFLLAAW